MGSFGDFYVKGSGNESDELAQAKFIFYSGAQAKTINNIRVYLEYGFERPIVELDFSSLDEDAKKELLNKFR